MKSYAKSWILKGILIIVFVAMDLITKFVLQKHFDDGGDVIKIIPNIFSLEYLKNTGISFGLFKGSKVASLILPILFLCVFVAYDIFTKEKKICYSIGFSLIIGGAIGNLYDRIVLKFVRDFFAFSFFPFIFNIADACICVGFVLIVIHLLISIFKPKKEDKAQINEKESKWKVFVWKKRFMWLKVKM